AAARRLGEDGIFVTQAIGIHYDAGDRLHAAIHHTLAQVFPHVRSYADYVQSFDYPWAFVVAARQAYWDAGAPDVDRVLAARGILLRFYDGITHLRVMNLPKPLRTLIAEETTVITDTEPLVVL
ncbi:MAG: spermidine synthase, partial [bacterium]